MKLLTAGADPYVLEHNGEYFYTQTTLVDIRIWRMSPGLTLSEPVIVWIPPPGMHNIWAPEMHFINGKFYIYFAGDDGKNENHRTYILEAEHPMGLWLFKGQLYTDRWAIDATVLQYNDQLYCLWSGWEGFEDGQQNIYISEMIDPFTLTGEKKLIASPEYPWEKECYGLNVKVNEGPQILKKNDKIYVVYSASGCWTDGYCLGLLTMGEDPMQPWLKAPAPVFKQNDHVYGCGHCGFMHVNGVDYLLYHAYDESGDKPNRLDDRSPRIQTFGWEGDVPVFGTPE